MAKIYESVQDYYGKVLKTSEDLQTNACTSCSKPSKQIADIIKLIHPEVESKYYGCGLVIPDILEGMRVLDLGSGSGRDCYILSKLVGEKGYVVGVDMTEQQIDTANQYIEFHTKKFGYTRPNIEFRKGYIEKLGELGLEDNSFDIVVSNCVINLSPDKEAVLREVFRVLKPGGELYFSDVYADRRVPRSLVENTVLYGECLSGALYWNDFLSISRKCGFADARLVEDAALNISNPSIEELIGHIKFSSSTFRLFKLSGLEYSCEDYGQAVVYVGGIATSPKEFRLDKQHVFPLGKTVTVCGNTFLMLKSTRFAPYFQFIGDQSTHFGLFEGCKPKIDFDLSHQTANNSVKRFSSCC